MKKKTGTAKTNLNFEERNIRIWIPDKLHQTSYNLNGLLKSYKARCTSLIRVNTIEVLISKALINSDISHDEFVSLNNVLWKHNDIKKAIRSLILSIQKIYKYD